VNPGRGSPPRSGYWMPDITFWNQARTCAAGQQPASPDMKIHPWGGFVPVHEAGWFRCQFPNHKGSCVTRLLRPPLAHRPARQRRLPVRARGFHRCRDAAGRADSWSPDHTNVAARPDATGSKIAGCSPPTPNVVAVLGPCSMAPPPRPDRTSQVSCGRRLLFGLAGTRQK